MLQTQDHLDLGTCDRLWVLTTKLRRLAAESLHIELRLGPRVLLTTHQVKKALQWV